MFSIIVPTFNEEKHLAGTLRALKKLRVRHEIIVADSGSKDRTVSIAREYADKVVSYTDAPRNAARGRNLGASVATGSFLVFIDADVSIADIDKFFTVASAAFLLNDKLVAIAPRVEILPHVRTRTDDWNCRACNTLMWALNNFLHLGFGSGDLQFIRASAFDAVGGYKIALNIGEDVELYKRLQMVGEVRYRNDLVVMHPGRRPHKIGWLRLWRDCIINVIAVRLFCRTWDADWRVIR